MQNTDATPAPDPGSGDGLEGIALPTDYLPQVAQALAHDRERASIYLKHTLIGDPEADETLAECSSLERAELYLFVQAGMDGDKAALADAPTALREFFERLDSMPDWFHETDPMPGIRSFHRNSSLILGAMVGGVLVEGFTTNISKSFFLSGRLRDQGVRRLKQNNRHMLEIFMPGGMDRQGDGFKLSVRIRLVHAHIRRLLEDSGDWDGEAWGVPVSSAHLGFAISAFSARLLYHAKRLGAQFSDEERASFMQVWRQTGHVMGIPEAILYRDEADALRTFDVGRMCEPPIDLESIAMANALENSAPVVVGIADPSRRRSLAKYVYNVSGALIGKEMATALRYPKRNTFGVLPLFRLDVRYKHLMARLFPNYAARMRQNDFTGMLGASAYDEAGLMCEPPPGLESVVMANALVNAAPLVIGQSDPEQRRGLAKYVYHVSSALIGKEMARDLRYPRHQTFGVLPLFRMDVRYKRLMGKLFPKRAASMRSSDFTGLLGASAYDDVGISYATPDKAHAEESSFW